MGAQKENQQLRKKLSRAEDEIAKLSETVDYLNAKIDRLERENEQLRVFADFKKPEGSLATTEIIFKEKE